MKKIIDIDEKDIEKLKTLHYGYYALLDVADIVKDDIQAYGRTIVELKKEKAELEQLKSELLEKYTGLDILPKDFIFNFNKKTLSYEENI